MIHDSRTPPSAAYLEYETLYVKYDGLRLHFIFPSRIPRFERVWNASTQAEERKVTVPAFCGQDNQTQSTQRYYIDLWNELTETIRQIIACDFVRPILSDKQKRAYENFLWGRVYNQ